MMLFTIFVGLGTEYLPHARLHCAWGCPSFAIQHRTVRIHVVKSSAKKGNPELLILIWKMYPAGYNPTIPP